MITAFITVNTVEKTYHRRSIVESAFSLFKCGSTASCSRKEAGDTKIAAAPQVRLLQPVVIVERHKKHVLCVQHMLYNPGTFWHKMYRIISCHGKIPTYAGNQKQ